MKIQRELDETKIVLHKTIESVLQRGEKIDDLVAKSDGLSAQSKMFYRAETSSLSLRAGYLLTLFYRTSEEAELMLRVDVKTGSLFLLLLGAFGDACFSRVSILRLAIRQCRLLLSPCVASDAVLLIVDETSHHVTNLSLLE
jgi:hypothetical protein